MPNEDKKFDVVVIGSGPGGYPAAIRAAQRGAKVAIIEAGELGGTCLNRGCIPSKTLISDADLFRKMKNAKKHGIETSQPILNYASMVERKDRVVDTMRQGIKGLLKANGVTHFQGFGAYLSKNEIQIKGSESFNISTTKSIIATGSEPRVIPAFAIDKTHIHDSTSLLELKNLPKSLCIIGGGVIGCEFASLYHELGVKVTILELLSRIIPTESEFLSQTLRKSLEKRGITIRTEVQVKGVTREGNGVKVTLEKSEPELFEMALISIGRTTNTQKIGLEKAQVKLSEKGGVITNEYMQTNVEGIYAIGDVTGKWWLAHVATHQGLVAAENATGQKKVMHYNAIPSVIYTYPEVASVGLSQEEAQKKGLASKSFSFPFQALGKSHALMETEGFTQVVVDQKTGAILGASVFGYEASTLIAEMALAIQNELTIECVADTIHAHPTLSESWQQVALIAEGMPVDFPPAKKV